MKRSIWLTLTILMISGIVIAAEITDKVEVKLTAAQQAVVDKVKALGGTVLRVAANSDAHEVAFHLSSNKNIDAALGLLKTIPNVTKLNLAGTDVSDAGLAQIAELNTLKHLHLEQTSIGDSGLDHLKGLANLEYLNLFGTQVTDQGLNELKALTNLKKLYLWQSKATKIGANDLAKSIPNLYVNTGEEALVIAPKPAPGSGNPPKPTPPKPVVSKENLTIKLIMEKVHKGENTLLAKAIGKKANNDEVRRLLAYYEALSLLKPKKGKLRSWKTRTWDLMSAVKLLDANLADQKGIDALKTASNCKACHTLHK